MSKRKKPMTRSEIMKKVKSKDTTIEVMLRKELYRRGLRYQKNVKTICGKPDIVFKGKKLAVFADSEFWHGKKLREGWSIPKTHTEYWVKKITRNMERDKEVNVQLKSEGWTILRFWEKDIRKDVSACADVVEKTFKKLQTRYN